MRRAVRFVALGTAVVALSLVLLALVTARSGDPKLWPAEPGAAVVEVYLVSNGYHAGLVLPTAQIAATAQQHGATALAIVAENFGSYPFIEIGWGEEQFYAAVPTAAQVTFGLAVRALFNPTNSSVLHVVGLPEAPRNVFRSADIVQMKLGASSFAGLVRAIEMTFAKNGEPKMPQALGRGLYATSLFYRAQRSFHIFNVCNHWAADMLSAAGLPMTPVLDTVPAGLLLDLKMRAGLERMPGSQR